MKILDTDHCVEILRGRLSVDNRIAQDEPLAITAITVAELSHGAWRSNKPTQNLNALDTLFATLVILPFDEPAARNFGELKAKLERSGQIVADLDLQIASIALTQNVALVTHNQRHFERISDLSLEDWL